ncbi:BTAD domain-containing putative transcriptional regulator [Micromonospora chersina]|uniref:AfsR/SARP family transcriptional regulator n=1 Tax=Micromonospora chersina TaxID=47854 RepID=UPI0037102026
MSTAQIRQGASLRLDRADDPRRPGRRSTAGHCWRSADCQVLQLPEAKFRRPPQHPGNHSSDTHCHDECRYRDRRWASVGGGSWVLRINVLGPVQAVHDGTPVRLGPKLVELLSVLLVDPGATVSTARTIDLLWGDEAPTGARTTLRSHVSHLRRALPGAALVTVGAGYRLDVSPDAVDAYRFERWCVEGRRLVAAGEPDLTERGVSMLADALALWRGPAFADVADRPWVLPRIAQLDAARRAARRGHAEALSALGRHAEAVALLSGIVVDDPYDEGVRRLLALALYAERRVDEAAEVCREGLVLLRERGLDAPELAELQRDVLHRRVPSPRQPADHRKPARPCLLPPDPPQFVGRSAELDQARRLLGVATVLVSGPAGVGKTQFTTRLAHAVRADFPDGQLYVNMRGFDPTGVPMTAAQALATFLDALGVAPERMPATVDAQAGLYRELLADRRVLVVLDNVRDAEQIRPLLPGASGCAAVVVSRNQLPGLVVAEGARPLRLDLLSRSESRELIVRRVGAARLAAEPAAVERIVEACGRLPLALAIVAARAATHPEFSLHALAGELHGLDAFAGTDADADVRAVFSCSYRNLEPAAARLFRLLAAHPGPDLTVAAAAGLAGAEPDRVRPALRELAAAHLVVEHTPGRYALHDLLRAYADELGRDDPDRSAATRRMVDQPALGAGRGRAAVAAPGPVGGPAARRRRDAGGVRGPGGGAGVVRRRARGAAGRVGSGGAGWSGRARVAAGVGGHELLRPARSLGGLGPRRAGGGRRSRAGGRPGGGGRGAPDRRRRVRAAARVRPGAGALCAGDGAVRHGG